MSERDGNIVKAATEVFARYGVAKTTMNDIARAAGVARQTLYNAYAGKEDVLRAVVREFSVNSHANVMAAWADEASVSGKLDRFFELVPINWYDKVRSSPESADLVDGVHRVAGDELKQAEAMWIGSFSTLVAAYPSVSNPAAVGEFIYSAAINAKYGAHSREILLQRLETLKAAVVALLDAP